MKDSAFTIATMWKRKLSVSAASASASNSPLIPNLLDDISLQIFARIPKDHHASLSPVSKAWHIALSSPALFNTRSDLRLKQQSLYIRINVKSTYLWHILNKIQNPRLSKTPNFLSSPTVPFRPTNLQTLGSTFAVLSTQIYIMGGSRNEIPVNNVWVFDCCSNTFQIGPQMIVGREFAAAEVVDGIIYVMGGGIWNDNAEKCMDWMEMFDPVIGVWQAVPVPVEVSAKWLSTSCVVDGKIYAMAHNCWLVYNPLTREWSSIETKTSNLRWRGRPAVVDNVIYCQQFSGTITGFDVEEEKWKKLNGSFPEFLSGITMSSLNGNLCVLLERKGGEKMEIMCVEIEVSKDDNDGGLNGLVLWSDVILELPLNSSVMHCLSVYL